MITQIMKAGDVEPIEFLARRETLGLSQDGLAKMLGVKQATVAHWERGARPIPKGVSGELEHLEDRQQTLINNTLDDIEAAGSDSVVEIVIPLDGADDAPAGFQRVVAANVLRDLRMEGVEARLLKDE